MHQCPRCSTRERGAFCSLADSSLAGLGRGRVSHRYRAGQVIFYEGTPSLAVYCIQSGLVRLYKSGGTERETLIRLLRPGEIMGYRAVISGEVFAATGAAVEDTVVCTIPRETFLRVLRDDPDFSFDMMTRLARELRVSEDEMMYRLHRPVAQRTARMLLLLADGAEPRDGLTLPVRREDVARMIGTTPETLSRTLHRFARRGVLSLDRRAIVIRDHAALRRLAGPDPLS